MFEDLFGAMYGTGGYYTNYSGSAGTRGSTGQPDSTPRSESVDSDEVRQAVDAITGGQYRDAVVYLSRVPAEQRDARWHYLCGLAYAGMSNYDKAIPEMQSAAKMDPYNDNYYNLLQSYRQKSRYASSYSTGANSLGCSGSFVKVLLAFILLSLLFSVLFPGYGFMPFLFFI